MNTLADYLMEHGILKNADAEAMATEIEARFARERDEVQEKLTALEGELEEATAKCAEMRSCIDMLDRLVSDKIGMTNTQRRVVTLARDTTDCGNTTDCGKPVSKPCHECREVTLPIITVTGPNVPRGTGKPKQFCSIQCFWKWIQRVEQVRDEWKHSSDGVYSWD